MTRAETIKPELLPQILPEGSVILDVRTHMEHAEKHLACAHKIVPLEELNPCDFMAKNSLDMNSNIYLLCRSGKRAVQAAQKFLAAGFSNVFVIEGGIIACENCDRAVEGYTSNSCSSSRQGAPISLERQVRIAAGLIVAIGSFMGLTWHTSFGVIPLITGCGLIFAGVTDRCGLALLITKAPWNKPQSTQLPHSA